MAVAGKKRGKKFVRLAPVLEEYLGLNASDFANYERRARWFAQRIRYRHGGMTPSDFADFLAAQKGVCAICKQPPDRAISTKGSLRNNISN